MHALKLKTMVNWPIPTKKEKVEAFLAFANYYLQFIVYHNAKTRAIIDLTKYVHFI